MKPLRSAKGERKIGGRGRCGGETGGCDDDAHRHARFGLGPRSFELARRLVGVAAAVCQRFRSRGKPSVLERESAILPVVHMRRIAIVSLLALSGSGCNSAQVAPQMACVASNAYFPACGNDGLTYANSSYAKCAGVAVAHEGQCADGSTDVDGGGGVDAALPEASAASVDAKPGADADCPAGERLCSVGCLGATACRVPPCPPIPPCAHPGP